jgi:hypothetical protein
MFDIVTLYIAPNTVRILVVSSLTISAVLVFIMAFAVTRGAGFHCPLAVLRGFQRLVLCALAISMAYVAAYVAEYAEDTVPLGLLLILFILFMVSTIVSGTRHLMAPAVVVDNSWSSAWKFFAEKMVGIWYKMSSFMLESDQPASPPRR